MALFENYSDEIPQTGEILEVNEDIPLHWWDGTYSGSWKALAKQQDRASVPGRN